MVLSTAYFPTTEFFAVLAGNSVVYLESCEHYVKQSWRNRCRILTAGGPMDLRVPVVHGADLYHTQITDVKVDYSTPWIARTKYAMDSAYYNSPFFEYYRDELFSIMDSCPECLWDLDLSLIAFFCRKIGLRTELRVTSEYHGTDIDIHPKHSSSYVQKPYWQVFREKFGFVAGLSVIDLLFNEGPESVCYL